MSDANTLMETTIETDDTLRVSVQSLEPGQFIWLLSLCVLCTYFCLFYLYKCVCGTGDLQSSGIADDTLDNQHSPYVKKFLYQTYVCKSCTKHWH